MRLEDEPPAALSSRMPTVSCDSSHVSLAVFDDKQALKLLNEQQASQMLFNQGNLPRLPIPSLEESAQDFLRACEPLLSEQEFAQTKAACSNFVANEGPR